MRIGPSTTIQLVDGSSRDEDRLVIMDDQSGDEVVITSESWPLLAYALTYLTGDQNGVALGIHEHSFVTEQIGVDGTGSPVRVRLCSCGSVAGYTGESA